MPANKVKIPRAHHTALKAKLTDPSNNMDDAAAAAFLAQLFAGDDTDTDGDGSDVDDAIG